MNVSDRNENEILSFLGRRWPALLAAAAAAGVGGVLVAEMFAVQTFTCVGSMLYNRSGAGAPQYQQPEMQSIVGLVKSQPVLDAASASLPWKPPAGALAASVQTEGVIGSNSLQFTMRGDDPERTRQSLDAVMQSLVRQAGALRTQTVAQILQSQESHLAKANQAAEDAAAELARFNRSHEITISVDDDLQRARDDIAAVETALETQQTARASPEEQLQRRRQLLQEQQDADSARLEREAALQLKANEFERAKRLHAKRYISDAEFRRVETELSTLQAQHTEAFEQRRSRLKLLGDALAAQLNQPAGAVEEVEHNAAAERIKAFLAQRRSEAARLNAVRPQADELRQAVVAAQAEVQRAAAQAATFRELRDAEYHDLVVIQRASPAFGAATSNKKKLIAGAAVVGFLGCLAPIALLDLLTRRKRGVDSTAGLARLPEIAPADPAGDDHSQQVRTLALRIQQSARVDGSISVFSALDDAAAPAELVAATAQCLALRGESVLVIDTTPEVGVAPSLAGQLVARPQVDPAVAVFNDWTGARPEAVSLPATAPDRSGSGLAALLRDGELAAVDVLRPGRHFDVLPVGDARLPAEAFASRRLSDVLAELRRRYSTILLIGPDASHAVDLEMLAARASSLVFVARRRGRPTPVALQTIDSLRAVSAPILGLVSV